MIRIMGPVHYTNAFEARFRFDFGFVVLEVASFRNVTNVFLPYDFTVRSNINKERASLDAFLTELRPETTCVRYFVKFGDREGRMEEQTKQGPEQDKAGPATKSSSPYDLPFGSR